MNIDEMNKCLSRFYVSVRKTDGTNYKETSLLAIRAAIDHHLKSPPFNCKFSICDNNSFSEANKTLNSYLKHLSNTGQIAGTVHKNPLTRQIVAKLYEAGELGQSNTRNPRVLLQTAWFYISLYFGRRGRENQATMKKSVLRLVQTASGEEYFELNKAEPGTVLTSKNHTGGLHGTEDHSDGKIFTLANSLKCPVKTIKAFLSHLNPESEALFQRPKEVSTKFHPTEDVVWYEVRKLGHNTLENMLKSMTQRADISPHLNVETRQIKALTGHRSDNSIESYCQRPTLDQFKQMSSALAAFVHGGEGSANPGNTMSIGAEEIPIEEIPTEEIQAKEIPPEEIPPDSRSPSIGAIPINTSHENFFQSGLNPGAILPSGNFHGCTFTFNVNVNNKK